MVGEDGPITALESCSEIDFEASSLVLLRWLVLGDLYGMGVLLNAPWCEPACTFRFPDRPFRRGPLQQTCHSLHLPWPLQQGCCI